MFVQPRAHTFPWAVYSDKITLTWFNCIIGYSGSGVKMKDFHLLNGAEGDECKAVMYQQDINLRHFIPKRGGSRCLPLPTGKRFFVREVT